MVPRLLAFLDEQPGSFPRLLHPQSQERRQQHTCVNVSANAVGQVRTAAWTEMRASADEIKGKMLLPVSVIASDALSDRMSEAVLEEDRPLLGAQVAWSAAVEMKMRLPSKDRVASHHNRGG